MGFFTMAANRIHTLSRRYEKALVIGVGEFCGTFMFLLLSFMGAQVALDNNPTIDGQKLDPATLLYIASSFGTALAVNVWVFYRVTGGMFNPAVRITNYYSSLPRFLTHNANMSIPCQK